MEIINEQENIMDTRTGEIVKIKDAVEEQKPFLIPLKDKDIKMLTKMAKPRRKNWMRNQPCICESGKKFKYCCWNKYI